MKNMMIKIKSKGCPSGMTLVELLISLVILSVGCMAAIQLQGVAMKGGHLANQLTIASFLAESRAEWIRTHAFNAIKEKREDGKKLTKSGEDCPTASDTYCYLRTTDINKIHEITDSNEIKSVTIIPPTPSSLVVTVTVQWPENRKNDHVTYSTVISTLDLENSN